MDRWAYSKAIDVKLIAAGKPTQNVFIESFNGKFRAECLNDYCFSNLTRSGRDRRLALKDGFAHKSVHYFIGETT